MLVIAEAAVRVAAPEAAGDRVYMHFNNPHREQSGFVPDDVLFWKLRPSHEIPKGAGVDPAWGVNESGFRGPDAPVEKPEGQFRIVTLGDSCTFGLGAPGPSYDETYSARLQKYLQWAWPKKNVRVLNFGCPGYTSYQGKILLRQKAIKYDPDIVVAYFGINDGFEAVGFADKDQRPAAGSIDEVRSMQGVLAQSALYRLLRRGVLETRRQSSTAPGTNGPIERVSIDDYHANLDEIATIAREAGATVYFVAPPYLELNGSLNQETHRRHEPAVDIMPFLRAETAKGRSVIFPNPDNVHPTPAGHDAIARALALRILRDYDPDNGEIAKLAPAEPGTAEQTEAAP
ncbi:MAG: SGNH/GDSL hydrolase family protein [Deltaproteobacteria bacterium]|nr:SGNH/GDSL hydrolase family protein [Deltaproteobacteria bacterium]